MESGTNGRVSLSSSRSFCVPCFVRKTTMMTIPFLLLRQELILGAQHILVNDVIELRCDCLRLADSFRCRYLVRCCGDLVLRVISHQGFKCSERPSSMSSAVVFMKKMPSSFDLSPALGLLLAFFEHCLHFWMNLSSFP